MEKFRQKGDKNPSKKRNDFAFYIYINHKVKHTRYASCFTHESKLLFWVTRNIYTKWYKEKGVISHEENKYKIWIEIFFF